MTQPGTTTEPALPTGCLANPGQPRLAVGGLTLRQWRHEDAASVMRAYADPEIHQWHARSMSTTQAEDWVTYEVQRWDEERGGSWAITREDSVLGRVGIGGVSLDEARAGVTYWVLPEARGHGVASLAVTAVVDWAFADVGFHRLELDHSTKNAASCRTATKAGFVGEGVKRSRGLHLDGWHDMHAHGLLADDPRPGRGGPHGLTSAASEVL